MFHVPKFWIVIAATVCRLYPIIQIEKFLGFNMSIQHYQPWPKFSYDEFKPTSHLLHMLLQAIGKLKLTSPFEPEWSNVGLWVTPKGISTGLIPYKHAGFSVEVNFLTHQVVTTTTWGKSNSFLLNSMSVAELTETFFTGLKNLEIDLSVNPKPQEVTQPILFHEDTAQGIYDHAIVNAWWRILVSSQRVMQKYHAKFFGKTPTIALMWGTLDLRDVRFNGEALTPTGINSGYFRRNSMDEKQIETGWWAGQDLYPRAAYYSFTYPQPESIEQATVKPASAYWNKALSEFILDYDEVYKAKNPDAQLLEFLESTYKEGSTLANWNSNLVRSGKPI